MHVLVDCRRPHRAFPRPIDHQIVGEVRRSLEVLLGIRPRTHQGVEQPETTQCKCGVVYDKGRHMTNENKIVSCCMWCVSNCGHNVKQISHTEMGMG